MSIATSHSSAAWPDPAVGETADGLRVVCLSRPGPVVALRLTFAGGARHDGVAGATHMLEHLLFRTPDGASARRDVERLGGEVGASTTREQLSLDLVVLPEDLEAALGALGRIARVSPRATDLEREKQVVVREVAHEAEERRRIWQLQAEALYGVDHPLARPILGSEDSIVALALTDLDRSASRLVAGSAALAAVGPVDAGAVCALAAGVVTPGPPPPPDPPGASPSGRAGRRHEERRGKLLHLAVGWRFGGVADPLLPALRLAEVILAHGSGSRLYDQLRTKRRLAYRVSTVLIPYADSGHLSAVTSCDPSHGAQAEQALVTELERLAARGPSWLELAGAKRQHAGTQARAFESSRRLAGYSASQLLWGRLQPLSTERERIDAVQPNDVRAACAGLLRGGHAVASVGRTAPLTGRAGSDPTQ